MRQAVDRRAHFTPSGVILVVTLSIAAGGCISLMQYRRLTASVDAVQAVCTGSARNVKDGWGHDLVVLNDSRGLMVVSMGKDGVLDRPIDEYWQPANCGVTVSDDADIVCVNGKLRQWPELARAAHERLLPRDCESRTRSNGD
jgi:hypothetical protein